MPRYLITQSLIAAWAYTFDCREGCEESAKNEFIRTLRREKGEQTEAMRNGVLFENAVYAMASGTPVKPGGQWETGVKAVANVIRGAQVQVKASRPLVLDGTEFLVYGILDALKAGVIYDVKFKNERFAYSEKDPGVYGKYLNSPQHPLYLYLIPEAFEFQYLLSDGEDLYIETYRRDQAMEAGDVVGEFIRSITDAGLLPLYQERWQAR